MTASIHLPVSVECPEISKERDLNLYTNSMFLFPQSVFFFWYVLVGNFSYSEVIQLLIMTSSLSFSLCMLA